MNGAQRLESLHALVSEIRDGTFDYQERPPPPIDWASYDQAQIHEASDVLNLIRELVDLAADRLEARTVRTPQRGQPPTPARDVTKVVLAQAYFGHANRPAEGLAELFREKLRLTRPVQYKTIERGYERHDVHQLLDAVFALANEPVKGLERVFSGDGSGASRRVGTHYQSTRARSRRKEAKTSDALPGKAGEYAYHFAIIGTKYKVLAAWNGVARMRPGRGEHSLFQAAAATLAGTGHTVERLLGDGIMATRPCCEIAAGMGATPRFLPKRNATFKSHGVHAWARMLGDLLDNPQEWMREYHERSISESGFSALNRANPRPLRKKLDVRVETEDYLRAVVYNIKRLAYLTHLAEIHPLPEG